MRSFIDVPRKFYRRIYGVYQSRLPEQWVASYGIRIGDIRKEATKFEHIVSSPHEGFIT